MQRHQGEPDPIDAWTGMPFDLDDAECASLAVPPAQPSAQVRGGFDVKSMFWKFVASGSSKTSPQILGILAADERSQIRRRVAENPSTNADVLAFLAEDSVEAVRLAVAKNKHTPVYTLRKLSHDKSADVRFAIASNKEMPDAILLSLFMDPDPLVADRASQTLAA